MMHFAEKCFKGCTQFNNYIRIIRTDYSIIIIGYILTGRIQYHLYHPRILKVSQTFTTKFEYSPMSFDNQVRSLHHRHLYCYGRKTDSHPLVEFCIVDSVALVMRPFFSNPHKTFCIKLEIVLFEIKIAVCYYFSNYQNLKFIFNTLQQNNHK